MGRSGRAVTGKDLFYGEDISQNIHKEKPKAKAEGRGFAADFLPDIAGMIAHINKEDNVNEPFVLQSFQPGPKTDTYTIWSDRRKGQKYEVAIITHPHNFVALKMTKGYGDNKEAIYIGTSFEEMCQVEPELRKDKYIEKAIRDYWQKLRDQIGHV